MFLYVLLFIILSVYSYINFINIIKKLIKNEDILSDLIGGCVAIALCALILLSFITK